LIEADCDRVAGSTGLTRTWCSAILQSIPFSVDLADYCQVLQVLGSFTFDVAAAITHAFKEGEQLWGKTVVLDPDSFRVLSSLLASR
jgi:hypothetical protein